VRARAVAVAALLAPAVAGAETLSPLSPLSPGRAAEIARDIREEAEAAHVPSFAYALVTRDRGVVLAGGSGEAGPGARVDEHTPLAIGSLSKSITALAAMQLAAAGKLELDAPVQRYLPAFRVADEAAVAHITLRHLLNQTSGFGGDAGCYGADTRSPDERLRGLATAHVRPPGRFLYCNANYELATLVLEAASGERYAALVKRTIFEPVRMTHAFADPAAALAGGLAFGHRDVFGFQTTTRGAPPATLPGAGGIAASASDMGRWLALLLGGGVIDGTRVTSEASVRALLDPPSLLKYGMGFRALRVGALDARMHDGTTSVFTSSMMLAENEGIAVVVLTGTGGLPLPYAEIHAHDIAARALRRMAGEAPPPRALVARMGLLVTKVAALAAALASVVVVLAGRRRTSLGRGTSLPARAARAALATAVDAALVWGALVFVPSVPDVPFAAVYHHAPDLGVALGVVAGLAVLRILLRGASWMWMRPRAAG
jgi:CubicO group peptidase (beta-lactamase class C family)